MDATSASKQWATRPADQTFPTIEALHKYNLHKRSISEEIMAPWKAFDIQLAHGETNKARPVLGVVNSKAIPAEFTHHSFTSLARQVGAPAEYLQTLPPALASQALQYGMHNLKDSADNHNFLFHKNGGYVLRGIASDRYVRIYDAEVSARLVEIKNVYGWQEAPESYDRASSGMAEGDLAGSCRGQYASDHDMFSFMVDNDRRIFETAPGGGFSRGIMVQNSEVPGVAFAVTAFLYNYVCGNHIIWGMRKLWEVRQRHIGANAKNIFDGGAFDRLTLTLKKYAEEGTGEDARMITKAIETVLGGDKAKMLDFVFGLNVTGLTRKMVTDGADRAEVREDRYGNPLSAWGLVNGITEVAGDLPFADQRQAMDIAAGKLLTRVVGEAPSTTKLLSAGV